MNLTILRKNKNVSQKELAEFLQMSQTAISHFETGRNEPDLKTVIKLADFFGCSVDYLIGHKTNDLIYLSGLSDVQKEMIEEVKQMTDDDLYILKGVLLRLKQEKENPWLKRN